MIALKMFNVQILIITFLIFVYIEQIIGTQSTLASKIACKEDEIHDYEYSSETSLWGEVDGKIVIFCNMRIQCLGNDTNGKYGSEGNKYLIQLQDLDISQKNPSKSKRELERKKRGFRDFASNSWRKVKNFFKRLFGRGDTDDSQTRPTIEPDNRSQHTPESKPPIIEDEDPQDFKYDSLYSAPFEFIQLANGSVPEVLFSDEDKDVRVRNFKRHLIDTFTTQLNMNPRHEVVVETTVLGEHLSNYNISVNGDTAPFSSSSLLLSEEDLKPEINKEKTVVVKKLITEEDILKLASNSEEPAINDREKMGLETRQTQIFKNGQLISTSGTSSLSIFDSKKKKKRARRDLSENKVMPFFKVKSSFDIQLKSRRKKRSADEPILAAYNKMQFSSASKTAEHEDSSEKQKLRDLQKSIGNTTSLINSLLNKNNSDYEENFQIILEMIVQEIRFGLDYEAQSASEAVRKTITKKVIDEKCPNNLNNCKDLIQLLARSGGRNTENILLSYVKSDSINYFNRQEIADMLSDLSNPSSDILRDIINILRSNALDSTLMGTLALSASNIAASKNTLDFKTQVSLLAEVLNDILKSSWSESKESPLTIDVLEAMGNLGHDSTINSIIELSSNAGDRIDIQVACAHGLRHMSSAPPVQKWMLDKIRSSPCDVQHAIVGSLLDKISAQELKGSEEWPRFGVNSVDFVLQEQVKTSSPKFACAIDDTARYFQRKSGEDAEKLTMNSYFGSDSESWEPDNMKGVKRKKRALSLNSLNCKEWVEDKSFQPIQGKDEFAADRETYNKSKSCLAYRQLGVDDAHAEIYAGMFAGVQDRGFQDKNQRPKYKLLTKFVSNTNFMGHETELGSFHFYHHSGYTKAYVRILGRTRQEFRHDGCIPADLKYRPITHIPLYQISMSVLQLSLGIHLSSQLALTTECPQYDVYDLRPMSDVRIGGEAMGTVLFARAALNLGGNFNYHLLFSFSPTPNMCLKGRHGYEPMSLSMEAYFRLWNAKKLGWGKPATWKPNSLVWKLNSANEQPWFNDTCILIDNPEKDNTVTTSKPTDNILNDSDLPLEDGENGLFVRT